MIGESPSIDVDTLWDFNDPAASESRFRERLPLVREAGDRAAEAVLLTQVARAQGLRRQFDQAHATLDAAEPLAGDAALPRTRILLERGRVLNSSGSPAAARPQFEQALQAATDATLDALAIDAAHMIAIVEPEPAAQLKWNLHALKLAESSSDPRGRRWRASLYNNIGWTYFGQKEYDQALKIFEKAVALRAEQQQPRELRIAWYCVAKTCRMQHRLDDAIAINRRIIAEAEAAGEPDGYFLEELAECLLASGQPDEARPYFRQAREHLSKDPWLATQEPQRLDRLANLAESG